MGGMKMRDCNIQNMTKLVEALESGEYDQGKARLRTRSPNGDQFCCLGVATDLAVKEGVGSWESEPTSRVNRDRIDYIRPDGSREGCGLTLEVCAWLGVRDDIDDLTLQEDETAIGMNDTGRSFAEIAAEIRKTYL